MGSSLGPTSANIFLCFHEKKWPTKLPCRSLNQYILGDMLAYFCFICHKNILQNLFYYLNTCHPGMCFSCQQEKNKKISFVDVEIAQQNGNFVTSLYHKCTFICIS